jgi:multisubunit Na+/H+ antiporter MnhF subunit
VKSLTDRPRPSPSIISAKQIGAIFVTISIICYSQSYNNITLKKFLISSIKSVGFSKAGK